mgnify:CR=1 FL=1
MLDGKDLKEQILKMLRQAVESRVKTYLPAETPKEDWNLEGLRDYYRGWLLGPDELQFTPSEVENLEAITLSTRFIRKRKLFMRTGRRFSALP